MNGGGKMNPSKKAGDEHVGKFVYCRQHLAVHSTGWCSVSPGEKIALKGQSQEAAWDEARCMGLYLFGCKG